jgi:hypothetical protein
MISPMTRLSRIASVVVAAVGLLMTSTPPTGAAPTPPWVWPLDPDPRLVRPFQPPLSPYGPGHRGVDLAGAVGQPVLAVAPGVVSFAGSVAGRGVVVIDHGALSSTYQPVSALLARGAHVSAGEPVGSLELIGSHCLPDPCLHLGAKRGDTYLDPLTLLPRRPVRLKPLVGQPLDGHLARRGGMPQWEPRRQRSWPRGEGYGAVDGATVGLAAGPSGNERQHGRPVRSAGPGHSQARGWAWR